MASSRNVLFLQPPTPQHRFGRAINDVTRIPKGAPVLVTGGARASDKRYLVGLAAADSPKPLPRRGGIIWFEDSYEAYHGFDPVLTVESDFDTVPPSKPCQLIYGDEVALQLTNTINHSFEGQRDYLGRVFVGGSLGSLSPGDTLTPGVGTDASGYWKKNAGAAANAWLEVTSVDAVNGVVEAACLV